MELSAIILVWAQIRSALALADRSITISNRENGCYREVYRVQ